MIAAYRAGLARHFFSHPVGPCMLFGLRDHRLRRCTSGLLGLSLLLSALPGMAESETLRTLQPGQQAADVDWHQRTQLTPAQLRQLPSYCPGTYLEPAFPLPLAADNSAEPLAARAGRLDFQLDGWAELEQGVLLRQGNRSLQAEQARFHDPTRQLHASGSLLLREPGLLVSAESAQLNLDSGAAQAEQVGFLLHGRALRGAAQRLHLDAAGNLQVDRASFTRCEPGHGGWQVTGARINIDQDSPWGKVRHAQLRIYNVPVLYVPYLEFPVTDERMSGFLLPDVGYSGDAGLDVRLPYYLNLAPNYDATLAPRTITRRGSGGDLELRHLGANSRTEAGGAFLYRDQRYNGTLDIDDYRALNLTAPFRPADRWLVSLEHEQRWGALRGRIDYAAVSDRDYFRDLGTDLGVSSQVQLERRGELRYRTGNLDARLWAQNYQRLDERSLPAYQRLPELELRYTGSSPGLLQTSLYSSWSRFERSRTALTGINAIQGNRLHLEPRLRLPLDAIYGFMHTELGYRYTAYDLTDVPSGVDASPTRRIALASVDGGLFFDRPLQALGQEWTQTLEPRLYYLYQQYRDQSELPRFDVTALNFSFSQLFRDNRFAGIDRIGDANQLSVAVTSRFLRADNGRERLRANLGQILYFDDRRVTRAGAPTLADRRSNSAWAGELVGGLGPHWRARASALWNPYDGALDESAVHLQYRGDRHRLGDGEKLLNLGLRTRRQDDPLVKQTEVSSYWPLAARWSVLGYWHYDLEYQRTLEGFAGLEYNDCCWRVRVVGRRHYRVPNSRLQDEGRNQRGIYVQLIFKGMADVGGRLESIMENGIRGYRAGDVHGY